MNDPVLEALWKKVVDDWDDDATHGAFLEHCQSTDQLPEAAARYRGMAGDRDRGPSAEKRLNGVAVLAMAKLDTMRTPEREIRRDIGKLIMIILFVAATAAILILAV